MPLQANSPHQRLIVKPSSDMPFNMPLSPYTPYPFGSYDSKTKDTIIITYRHPVTSQVTAKLDVYQFLKHDSLIRLESVKQIKLKVNGATELELGYQYVPIQLAQWIASINEQFIADLEQRIILFSRSLAEQGIVIQFNMARIGISKQYLPKYFLGLDFEVKPEIDRAALKKKYRQEVRQTFEPHLIKKKKTMTDCSQSMIVTNSIQNKLMRMPDNSLQPAVLQGTISLESKMNKIWTTLASIKSGMKGKLAEEVFTTSKSKLTPNEAYSKILLRQGSPVEKKTSGSEQLIPHSNDRPQSQSHTKSEYQKMVDSGDNYMQDFLNVLQEQQPSQFEELQKSSASLSVHQTGSRTKELITPRYSQRAPHPECPQSSTDRPSSHTSHFNTVDDLQKKVEAIIAKSMGVMGRLKKIRS